MKLVRLTTSSDVLVSMQVSNDVTQIGPVTSRPTPHVGLKAENSFNRWVELFKFYVQVTIILDDVCPLSIIRVPTVQWTLRESIVQLSVEKH